MADERILLDDNSRSGMAGSTGGASGEIRNVLVDGQGRLILGAGSATVGTVTIIEAHNIVGTFRKTNSLAGSAEVFANNPCKKCLVQALVNNNDAISVGDSNVVSTATAHRGIILYTSQSQVFNVSNTNLLYLDVNVGGEGVSIYYEN